MLNASICTPSYNRRDLLLTTLRSLDRQTVDPDRFEVVVVDDGSTDGTVETLADLSTRYRLRWVTQQNAGPAAATNAAAELAEHDVLIFLDADQICDPEMVATHLETHEREGNVFVQGLFPLAEGYRSRASSLLYEKSLLDALAPLDRRHPLSPHMWSAQVSVRRSAWEEVGGFDTSFRAYGGEDTDFGLRIAALGIPFVFEPRALSYHLHEVSYGAFGRQGFDEGRSVIRLANKHGLRMEDLFGGPLRNPIDRPVLAAWRATPQGMRALGWAMTNGVRMTDLLRVPAAQLLAARLVYRFYKLGGLAAEMRRSVESAGPGGVEPGLHSDAVPPAAAQGR